MSDIDPSGTPRDHVERLVDGERITDLVGPEVDQLYASVRGLWEAIADKGPGNQVYLACLGGQTIVIGRVEQPIPRRFAPSVMGRLARFVTHRLDSEIDSLNAVVYSAKIVTTTEPDRITTVRVTAPRRGQSAATANVTTETRTDGADFGWVQTRGGKLVPKHDARLSLNDMTTDEVLFAIRQAEALITTGTAVTADSLIASRQLGEHSTIEGTEALALEDGITRIIAQSGLDLQALARRPHTSIAIEPQEAGDPAGTGDVEAMWVVQAPGDKRERTVGKVVALRSGVVVTVLTTYQGQNVTRCTINYGYNTGGPFGTRRPVALGPADRARIHSSIVDQLATSKLTIATAEKQNPS